MAARNAKELMRMGPVEIPYLWEPIIPKVGVGVIAGKPDVGKSQFARQLCAQVAMGRLEFLGKALNGCFKNAICVLTEDNELAIRSQLPRYFENADQAPETLRFIFAENMSRDETISTLKEELEKAPADIVVVDSFGDIFKGDDSNSNMAMRKTVKPFSALAAEYNCFVLFVHHINKAAYDKSPGQEHIQGGSGLAQKVRVALVLRDGVDDKRYLSIVKSNYAPKHLKKTALELSFDEATLTFTQTGKTLHPDEIGELFIIKNQLPRVSAIFNGYEKLSYSEFVSQYRGLTGQSKSTAKRKLKGYLELDLIVQRDGYYYLPEGEESSA